MTDTAAPARPAPHAISHNVTAYTHKGGVAHIGGMASELLADCSAKYSPNGDTLAAAHKLARRFLEHDVAAYVVISESHQAYSWSSWTRGPVVATVYRPGESPAEKKAAAEELRATLRRPCPQGGDHEEGSRWYTCLGCYAD